MFGANKGDFSGYGVHLSLLRAFLSLLSPDKMKLSEIPF